MTIAIEHLATKIVDLSETEQRALLRRVAELNVQRGLAELSELYRGRLRRQGDLDRSAADILATLRGIREVGAARDHPG